MTVGFAVCGSFCTFNAVFPIMELLTKEFDIVPILSHAAGTTDTRFGKAADHIRKVTSICEKEPVLSIDQAEPIGPKKLLDALIVAPCTGNTLAKLSHGIADGPVTMAVKSHLRNGRPVIVAVSTNDGLGTAAENIGRLMSRKNYYLVPFRQDDPHGKPASLIADMSRIPEALQCAMDGHQVQPVIL